MHYWWLSKCSFLSQFDIRPTRKQANIYRMTEGYCLVRNDSTKISHICNRQYTGSTKTIPLKWDILVAPRSYGLQAPSRICWRAKCIIIILGYWWERVCNRMVIVSMLISSSIKWRVEEDEVCETRRRYSVASNDADNIMVIPSPQPMIPANPRSLSWWSFTIFKIISVNIQFQPLHACMMKRNNTII